MRAIIPVAGFGTRMRPHTFTVPKVLLNVAGKPMLDHIIDSLVAAGIEGVTLIVGYLGDVIEQHVRKTYPNLDNHFVVQEEMLGLGHAIWLGKDVHRHDKDLLIILGDTIIKADFRRLFATPTTAIAVREVDDPRRFGVVELRPDGTILRMLEKPEVPPTKKAIVGVYKMNDPALLFGCLDDLIKNNVRTKKEYQLTDALEAMIQKGHTMVPFDIDAWLDCGKPETLFETNRALLAEVPQQLDEWRRRFPTAAIRTPVFIGEGAVIENSVVGPNTVLGAGARIKEAMIADSIVGDGATICGIMMRESLIGANATVISKSTHRLNIGDSSMIEMD